MDIFEEAKKITGIDFNTFVKDNFQQIQTTSYVSYLKSIKYNIGDIYFEFLVDRKDTWDIQNICAITINFFLEKKPIKFSFQSKNGHFKKMGFYGIFPNGKDLFIEDILKYNFDNVCDVSNFKNVEEVKKFVLEQTNNFSYFKHKDSYFLDMDASVFEKDNKFETNFWDNFQKEDSNIFTEYNLKFSNTIFARLFIYKESLNKLNKFYCCGNLFIDGFEIPIKNTNIFYISYFKPGSYKWFDVDSKKIITLNKDGKPFTSDIVSDTGIKIDNICDYFVNPEKFDDLIKEIEKVIE